MADQFNVFLCHNSQDKDEVIKIANILQKRGLNPWLDVWDLHPGLPWQEQLEKQIEQSKSAAVFIGSSGFGPWQENEMRAFLSQFHKRRCPVIPVLLKSAPQKLELPIFLKAMTWVDFKSDYYDPMEQLIWGITGVKPPPPNGKGIDYSKLRDFLRQQKWEEANEETGEIILQILSKEKEGWIKPEDIDILPCDDLRTIDQLWVKASSGHFGFSVQKQIWKDVGGNLEENDYEIYKKFGEIVGWYDRDRDHWKWSKHLTFSFNSAQKGHLPRLKFKMVLNTTLLSQLTLSIFSRYETCCSGEVELKSEKGSDLFDTF